MSVHFIKSNTEAVDHEKWRQWLISVAKLRKKYLDNEEGVDPFDFNEAASVSIMASAAYDCGGYALAEYISEKRHKLDRKLKSNGRDDLYVVLNDEGWVFECKQLFRPTPSKLKLQFKAARKCAKRTDCMEEERGVAVLIIYITNYYLEKGLQKKYIENILKFSRKTKKVKLAICLDDDIENGRCFMLFSDPF